MTSCFNRTHHWFLTGSIASLILAGGALAAGTPTPTTAHLSKTAKAVWLTPLVVNGQRIPMPVALQMAKAALKRPWSSAAQDREVLVCRTPEATGSHIRVLRCQTNAAYFREEDATQTGLLLSLNGSHRVPWEDVSNALNARAINASVLNSLLAKLPPADASYTLQVKDHGKITAKYTFKKGRLVKVWHLDKKKQEEQKSGAGNR